MTRRTLGLALVVLGVAVTGWRLADRETAVAIPATVAGPAPATTLPPKVSQATRPPALPVDAPEAIRAVVARFELGDALEEYRHLDSAELILQMDDLRAERRELEAETSRLDAQHSQALEAGDRGRVVELRRAIVEAVTARNRLAASLLVAGYVQSVSATPGPGT